MAETRYTVVQSTLDGVGYENYSADDRSVVDAFNINSAFDEATHNIELHIYGLDGTLLDSNLNYRGAQQLQGAENGANLSIDPERDAVAAGYDQGGVKLLYNFLNNISPEEFFIQEISADRTELRVLPVSPTFDATETVSAIQDLINTGAYFNEFRLNFGGNDLLIGINIDINNSVLIKLYEPLPSQYSTKSRFTFDEIVSDSVVFEVEAEFIPDAPVYPTLRGANFNIDTGEEKVQPTEYFDYNELYSYDVTSSLHGVITQLSSSGIQLSIDYTEYENFVHFGSSEERLRNFNYKMGLLESYDYSASISTTYQPHYDNLTKGVIAKFDDYEKYLYFESGAKAWPKTNSTKPYINDTVANSTSWFNDQVASASLYDELNESRLTYTVPEFIREDASNEPYTLFLDMIGQHFDNLWIYSKAMTDKYDADNRLNVGVSRELVGDVLKSFGVKLYSSNFSVSNLAASFIGEFYQSGSEIINSFVTASNDPTPDKDLLSETYKRIYHNLPYLIKTKGTERGLRALINCFGIPSGSLEITEAGGYTKDDYFFNRSETVDKIRLDNTGSIVSGDTLSQYASIQNIDDKYTQDSHQIDVSFSPAKYLNTHIENNITGSYPSGFNIDEYIGDINLQSSGSYKDLYDIAETALSGSDRYDTFDFVRLIKFFDNQLFKMIKDYVPARAVTTTGITVKPHILNRSKIKSPVPTWTRPEYSGSIDTAFIQGGEGGTVTSSLDTTHTLTISTKSGSIERTIDNNSPEFNGELGGTVLTVTTQSLNIANTYVDGSHPDVKYNSTRTTIPLTSEFAGDADAYPSESIATGGINIRYKQTSELPDPVKYNLIDAKVNKTTSNGLDLEGNINRATHIYIQGNAYKVESIREYTNHYYFDFVLETDVTRITATTDDAVVFGGYVDKLFYNSDYNVLINNASNIRESKQFLQSDRLSGLNPNNLTAITSTSASRAEIQDSNYSSKAYSNIRYNGSKNTATALNVENGSIDRTDAIIVEFEWGGGTYPMIHDAGGLKTRKVVLVGGDKDDVAIFNSEETGYTSSIQHAFPVNSKPVVSQYVTTSTNADGARVAAYGFTVPALPFAILPASSSGVKSEFDYWNTLASTGRAINLSYGDTNNPCSFKAVKNSSGVITKDYQISAAGLRNAVSDGIAAGEDWYVTFYIDMPDELQGTLRTYVGEGVGYDTKNSEGEYDYPLRAKGVFKIIAAGTSGGEAKLRLEDSATLLPTSGNIGGASGNRGMIVWKAIPNEKFIIFNDATMSGVGKGALTTSTPSSLIKSEFEYITYKYANND